MEPIRITTTLTEAIIKRDDETGAITVRLDMDCGHIEIVPTADLIQEIEDMWKWRRFAAVDLAIAVREHSLPPNPGV